MSGPVDACLPKPSGSTPHAGGTPSGSTGGATSCRAGHANYGTNVCCDGATEGEDHWLKTAPGWLVSAERLRPLRHDRQRLGVGGGLARAVRQRVRKPTLRGQRRVQAGWLGEARGSMIPRCCGCRCASPSTRRGERATSGRAVHEICRPCWCRAASRVSRSDLLTLLA